MHDKEFNQRINLITARERAKTKCFIENLPKRPTIKEIEKKDRIYLLDTEKFIDLQGMYEVDMQVEGRPEVYAWNWAHLPKNEIKCLRILYTEEYNRIAIVTNENEMIKRYEELCGRYEAKLEMAKKEGWL